jgi:hypothetical protein
LEEGKMVRGCVLAMVRTWKVLSMVAGSDVSWGLRREMEEAMQISKGEVGVRKVLLEGTSLEGGWLEEEEEEEEEMVGGEGKDGGGGGGGGGVGKGTLGLTQVYLQGKAEEVQQRLKVEGDKLKRTRVFQMEDDGESPMCMTVFRRLPPEGGGGGGGGGGKYGHTHTVPAQPWAQGEGSFSVVATNDAFNRSFATAVGEGQLFADVVENKTLFSLLLTR